MSIRMVLKTTKNKDMGRSYNLKKSPINKGTAAKPSPMKIEPVTTAALISAGAMLVGKGIDAVGGAKKKKEMKKLNAQNRKDSVIENMDTFNKDLTGASAKTNILDD